MKTETKTFTAGTIAGGIVVGASALAMVLGDFGRPGKLVRLTEDMEVRAKWEHADRLSPMPLGTLVGADAEGGFLDILMRDGGPVLAGVGASLGLRFVDLEGVDPDEVHWMGEIVGMKTVYGASGHLVEIRLREATDETHVSTTGDFPIPLVLPD